MCVCFAIDVWRKCVRLPPLDGSITVRTATCSECTCGTALTLFHCTNGVRHEFLYFSSFPLSPHRSKSWYGHLLFPSSNVSSPVTLFLPLGAVPKIVDLKSEHQILVGNRLKIFCNVEQGSKPFTFEWHKDGKQVVHSREAHVSVETSSDTSVLTIERVDISDGGNYSCSVRNQLGSDGQSTRLTVKGLAHSPLHLPTIIMLSGANLIPRLERSLTFSFDVWRIS